MNTTDVRVSRHAVERWRERVTAGAGADAGDVKAAALAARPVLPGTPLPFGKLHEPGAEYRYDGAVLYVLRACGANALRVVTVMVSDHVKHLRRKKPARLPAGRAGVRRTRRVAGWECEE